MLRTHHSELLFRLDKVEALLHRRPMRSRVDTKLAVPEAEPRRTRRGDGRRDPEGLNDVKSSSSLENVLDVPQKPAGRAPERQANKFTGSSHSWVAEALSEGWSRPHQSGIDSYHILFHVKLLSPVSSLPH